MFIMRWLVTGLLAVLLMSACAQKLHEHRGKVYCPDCGAEVEVLFEKSY